MTTYFFDLVDNGTHYTGSEGVHLEDEAHAIREARSILGDLLRHGTATDFDRMDGAHLLVVVRTVDVPNVITMRLTLSVEVQSVAGVAH